MINKELYELNLCKFSNWYSLFQTITITSEIIKIPKNVLNYFRDEIIILPKECNPIEHHDNVIYSYDNVVDDESDDDEEIRQEEFPEFSNHIKDVIKRLGGTVFLKTEWHCPRDSYWITVDQTLKVKDITDFYLLVKSSSIVKNDFNFENNSLEDDEDQIIILKKWKDIHPGTEFRCFVKNKCLIAISPRDWPNYHEHIANQKNAIITDITSLFMEKIKNKFSLNNYYFDVVREKENTIHLIDFSPLIKAQTQTLAFSWEELENDLNIEHDEPEFRYIHTNIGIQPNPRNNFGFSRDIIEMFQSTTSNPDQFSIDNLSLWSGGNQ